MTPQFLDHGLTGPLSRTNKPDPLGFAIKPNSFYRRILEVKVKVSQKATKILRLISGFFCG